MDDKYKEIKKLIKEHSDIVEFADFRDGVSSEWIKKAEDYMGIKLPPSYKWW